MRWVTSGIYLWVKRVTVVVTVLLLSFAAKATHIIGGDVSMRAIGSTPGLFQLQLNQYWDQTKTSSGNRDEFVTLLVYRKQDPILVERIALNLQETIPLTFDNEACATLRKLEFTQAKYYTTYQFDIQQYNDPGGYYIVWERCCRTDDLTNVNSGTAAGVGMVFYLKFPAMTKNGAYVKNSAPDFGIPNGDYICINKPFTFNAGATDADGDQLKYSLATPLNGYTNRGVPSSIDQSPRSSYPTIAWAPGYNLSNVIPGNPALRINPTTGQLSVRANQTGLYLFTVQCEEYRNGVLIGVVRRDFQLPVVDCSKNTPPPATVLADGKPTSTVNWCGSKPLVLSVEKNPAWAYQWQKDGTNIRGSTTDTLMVAESGVYTVVKSQANVCANDTLSQAVKVNVSATAAVKLSVSTPGPYCAGDTITIQADGRPGTLYQWRRDGRTIAGEQATLRVYQSGTYRVLTKSAVSVCDGLDSVQLTVNAKPVAQLSAAAAKICPDSSVQLTAGTASGNSYSWALDGTKLANTDGQLAARQTGTYQVIVTAPTGCTALSNAYTLGQFDRPAVQFDSVASVCVTNPALIALRGQPAGGIYSGVGVRDNSFDPVTAGVGRHELRYTITSTDGCRASQARWAVVSGGPTLTGQTTYEIIKGSTVQLAMQSDEPIRQYTWSPPVALSQADVASPEASPDETTSYQLTAVSVSGCVATFAVLVEVSEPLYIPSAFSPNADGMNDSWIIPNISSFPQAEVSVYSRWGELIFFSKGYTQPWDGTYKQETVRTGVYTYQIKTNNGTLNTTYRGQLSVIH